MDHASEDHSLFVPISLFIPKIMSGSQKFRNGVQRTMDAGFLNVLFHRAGYQVLFHLIFSGQIEGSPA